MKRKFMLYLRFNNFLKWAVIYGIYSHCFFPLLHEGENFTRRFVDIKLEREVKASPGL